MCLRRCLRSVLSVSPACCLQASEETRALITLAASSPCLVKLAKPGNYELFTPTVLGHQCWPFFKSTDAHACVWVCKSVCACTCLWGYLYLIRTSLSVGNTTSMCAHVHVFEHQLCYLLWQRCAFNSRTSPTFKRPKWFERTKKHSNVCEALHEFSFLTAYTQF